MASTQSLLDKATNQSSNASAQVVVKGTNKSLEMFKTDTLYFFYKNHVYKNVEAQIPENLRTC